MADNIFITGSTGFFGSRLVAEFLENTDAHLFLLVRAGRRREPLSRLESALKKTAGKGRLKGFLKRIDIVEGDLEKENLGIGRDRVKALAEATDVIIHSAALLDIRGAGAEIRRTNVYGSRNLLEFASRCKREGRLKRLNHISTAYVIGRKGMDDITFYERQLDISQGFNNLYEESKFEAERVAERFRRKGLDIDIYRPSIIGDTLSLDEANSFSTFFRSFKFIINGIFEEVPIAPDARYNLISVGDAAHAVFLISTSAAGRGRNYHIVNPREVRFVDLLDVAMEVFRFKRPRLIPLEKFDMDRLSGVQKIFIRPYLPYLNFRARFDDTNAERILKRRSFRYIYLNRQRIKAIFKYISKARPIRFYE